MRALKLSLLLPGFGEIGNNPAKNFSLTKETSTLGYIITQLGNVAIFLGAFLMFFWAVWGVFDYIRAEGNKEALAKARKRIQWAIAGFIILLLAFFVSGAVQTYLDPQTPNLQIIKSPK